MLLMLESDCIGYSRPEVPRPSYLDGVKQSLSVFHSRHRLLEEMVDPKFEKLFEGVSKV